MADLTLITRNILGTGEVNFPGENLDYPKDRLYDRDKNGLCLFATHDLMDGDILDEDCSAIPGSDPAWTDNDAGSGSSTVSGGKFNMDGGGAGAGNYAQLDAALGSVIRTAATRTTIEIALNHTTLGTLANVDYFELLVELSNNLAFRARFATDGLYIRGASADGEAGADAVSTGTDQVFRFAIDHGIEQLAKVNIYKDGALVAYGVGCAYYSLGGFNEGDVRLTQKGDTTANTETDVDYIYIDADLYPGPIQIDVDQTDDPKAVDIAIIESHNWDGQPVALKYFKDLTGGILDEDFADLTDWTDQDNNGESSAVTFDGESCARFYNESAAGGDYAQRYQALGSVFGDQTTIEIKLYHALIGTYANADYFRLRFSLSSNLRVYLNWCSNGLLIYDGAAANEVGVNVVDLDAWTTWRFVVDHRVEANATCNVYKKEEGGSWSLIAENIDCSDVPGGLTEGEVFLTQYGETTDDVLTYVDYVKIDDGLVEWADAVTPFLQSGNDRIVKTFSEITAPLWRVEVGELPGLLMNEECVSFSDPYTWTDNDAGTGASTVVTGSPGTYDRVFSCYGGNAGAGHYSRIDAALGSVLGVRTTIEITLYHSTLGARGDNDYFQFVFDLSSGLRIQLHFATDGLFVYAGVGDGWQEIGSDLVYPGVKQRWRFVISHEIEHEATVDAYLDDALQDSGVDCSYTGSYTEGNILLRQYGNTTADTLTYVFSLKIDDGLIPPWQGDISAPQAGEITLGLRALSMVCAWPGPKSLGQEPNTVVHFSRTGHRWPATKGEPRWACDYEVRGLASSERPDLDACLEEIGHFRAFYLFDHEGLLRHVHLKEPVTFSQLTNNRWRLGLALLEAL